jgi:hypothetical protein
MLTSAQACFRTQQAPIILPYFDHFPTFLPPVTIPIPQLRYSFASAGQLQSTLEPSFEQGLFGSSGHKTGARSRQSSGDKAGVKYGLAAAPILALKSTSIAKLHDCLHCEQSLLTVVRQRCRVNYRTGPRS